MSEENVEIVRFRISIPDRTRRRTVSEHVLVRLPFLARPLASAWARLPPRSALRRRLLAWVVRRGAEAANRRDFDFLFLALDPEIEFRFTGEFIPPDFLGWQRGHEGYRRVWNAGIETWEDLRLEFEEVIDLGNRLLLCGRQLGHGTASGVLVSQPMFQLHTLRNGLVIRQENFTDRAQALEAAGLSE